MTSRFLLSASVVFAILTGGPSLFGDETHAKGPQPRHIAFGEKVLLTDYLVNRKFTIFDFYSDFCPPCRALEPYLETLHSKRDDIAVVIVNINRPGVQGIDWGSPIAQEFQLKSIPHLVIYNEEGEIAAEGQDALAKIVEWSKP